MSGFERILARVGGDALRDYCSSAIEDELANLKDKMQLCLASVEKALEVQDAILKLNVPLTDNAPTFAAIRSSYRKFDDDLDKFIKEQRKVHAADVAHASAKRGRAESSSKSTNSASELEITQLVGKIQQRLTRKQRDWIRKTIDDAGAIATHLKRCEPAQDVRNDVVLVLDHFISAVLLSAEVSDAVLAELTAMLAAFVGAHDDVDDYIRSARKLLASKRSAASNAPQEQHHRHIPSHQSSASFTAAHQSTSAFAPAPAHESSAPPGIVHLVDPTHFNSRTSAVVTAAPWSSEVSSSSASPRIKKPKVEHNALDVLVKNERAATESAGPFEVHVYDLPWGALQSEVETYFSGAGAIASIRMPTMEDGSTVGVAIIRFAAHASMHTALRMDGYHFQGKTIRVTVPAK